MFYSKTNKMGIFSKLFGGEQTHNRFKKGKQDGLWYGLTQDGRHYKGYFDEGIPTGKWIFYHPRMIVESEGNYANGIKDGKRIYYYENGNKKAKGTHYNGKKEGERTFYYENGTIKHNEFYKNGTIDGKVVKYDENGLIECIFEIKNGVSIESSYKEFNYNKYLPYNIKKIFLFDTETTGTTPGKDYIIQFGGKYGLLNTNNWEFENWLDINQLINIPIKIPQSASDVHHIYDSDITGFDYIDTYINTFLAYIKEANYVVGHNIDFDKKMLMGECERLGISFDFDSINWIDTMKSTAELVGIRREDGSFKRPKLSELYNFLFGKGFEDAHDAMADITATKDCFIKLCKDYNLGFDGKLERIEHSNNKSHKSNLEAKIKHGSVEYDKYGYDKEGFDRYGFDKNGIHKITGTKYDEEGFDIRGFNTRGYDSEGYDKFGYNVKKCENMRNIFINNGINIFGIHKVTQNYKSAEELYDETEEKVNNGILDYNIIERKKNFKGGEGEYINGYDRHGENPEGYTKYGFRKDRDKCGIDFNGFYENGDYRFNRAKYNLYGYDLNLLHVDGYSNGGYDKYGFDKRGINKDTGTKYNLDGFDRRGFNINTFTWYDKEGFDLSGFNEKGINKFTGSEYDKEGFNKRFFNKEGIHKYTKEHLNERGFDKDGRYYPTGEYYRDVLDAYYYNGYNKNDKSFECLEYDEDGEPEKIRIKYDRSGYDINRNCKPGMGSIANGTDSKGWSYSGINRFTGTIYDKYGFDWDGNMFDIKKCIKE